MEPAPARRSRDVDTSCHLTAPSPRFFPPLIDVRRKSLSFAWSATGGGGGGAAESVHAL